MASAAVSDDVLKSKKGNECSLIVTIPTYHWKLYLSHSEFVERIWDLKGISRLTFKEWFTRFLTAQLNESGTPCLLNCKFNWHSPRIKALQRIRSGSQYSQNKNESIDEQGIDMDLIRNQLHQNSYTTYTDTNKTPNKTSNDEFNNPKIWSGCFECAFPACRMVFTARVISMNEKNVEISISWDDCPNKNVHYTEVKELKSKTKLKVDYAMKERLNELAKYYVMYSDQSEMITVGDDVEIIESDDIIPIEEENNGNKCVAEVASENDDDDEDDERTIALVEKALFKYVTHAMDINVPVTEQILKSKAQKFYTKMNKTKRNTFNASHDWLIQFAKKYELSSLCAPKGHQLDPNEEELFDDFIINEILLEKVDKTMNSSSTQLSPQPTLQQQQQQQPQGTAENRHQDLIEISEDENDEIREMNNEASVSSCGEKKSSEAVVVVSPSEVATSSNEVEAVASSITMIPENGLFIKIATKDWDRYLNLPDFASTRRCWQNTQRKAFKAPFTRILTEKAQEIGIVCMLSNVFNWHSASGHTIWRGIYKCLYRNCPARYKIVAKSKNKDYVNICIIQEGTPNHEHQIKYMNLPIEKRASGNTEEDSLDDNQDQNESTKSLTNILPTRSSNRLATKKLRRYEEEAVECDVSLSQDDQQFPLVEKALFKYYTNAVENKLPLSIEFLQKKAEKYFVEIRVRNLAAAMPNTFNASDSWISKFAENCNIDLTKLPKKSRYTKLIDNAEDDRVDDDVLNDILISEVCETMSIETKQEEEDIAQNECDYNNDLNEGVANNQLPLISHEEGARAFKGLCRYLKQFESTTDSDIAIIANVFTKAF